MVPWATLHVEGFGRLCIRASSECVSLRRTGSSKRDGAEPKRTADALVCWGMGKPIVLTILDGWGYRAETHGNAIAQARKPTYDALLREYPNTLLRASEHFVGLPDGQMGNSEVGHLNWGRGGWCGWI